MRLGRAMWHADVSMTSSRGSAVLTLAWHHPWGRLCWHQHSPMLTSALTVNADLVNGQRLEGPTCQWLGLTDRWDPRVSTDINEKEKRKREEGFSGSKCFQTLFDLGPFGPVSDQLPSLLFFFSFSCFLSLTALARALAPSLSLTTRSHLSAVVDLVRQHSDPVPLVLFP